MKGVVLIAGKEIREGMRNRWVVAATLLLATLALTLAFLGAAPAGRVGAGALEVVVVSLSSLSIFLLPLIALLISHDAIVGEMERGTMLLLLSYPLARWQVVLGKFVGHVAILATATTPVGPDETAGELEARLAELGVPVVEEALALFETWDGTDMLGRWQDPAAVTKAPSAFTTRSGASTPGRGPTRSGSARAARR